MNRPFLPPASGLPGALGDATPLPERIQNLLDTHRVVLFMKGTPQFPMCGFSSRAVQILAANGVTDPFTVNVLEDDAMRQGIKAFANWPTIPQLYVRGEFIGGSDIMMQMHQSGEMKALLDGLA